MKEKVRKNLKYGVIGAVGGATITAVLLMVILSLAFVSNPLSLGIVSEEAPYAHSVVKVYVKRAGTDEWVLVDYQPNVVVTIGATWVKDYLRQGTTGATNATDDISVGNNTTPAIGDTMLDQEQDGNGVTRTSGTVTNINATAYNCTHTWTATGTVYQMNATGLHRSPDAGTDSNMVFIATINDVSLNTDDQLQVTWEVDVVDQ